MFVKLETHSEPVVDDTAMTGAIQLDPRLGTLAGNYRLVARLGEGGMASVYRGEHRDISGAVVAVKLLDRRLATTPGTSRRFLREAQAMFELMGRNRHIPRVLDYGKTASGESYMVMEYLQGRDLAKVLQMDGPLPWSRVAQFALQLCEALAAAHARDIIHRDIKPSNCFLIEENGVELVKLIDFGIAKDLRVVADPTDASTIVGTPAYLAPEILIDGHRPSVRSDIYSLGATLYKLLTNKSHVTGQTWQDIAYHLRFVPIVPPSGHLGGAVQSLPRAVDALLLRALDRDPGQRYDSADEFSAAIRAASLQPSPATQRWRAARWLGGRLSSGLSMAPLLTIGLFGLNDAPPAVSASAAEAEPTPSEAERDATELRGQSLFESAAGGGIAPLPPADPSEQPPGDIGQAPQDPPPPESSSPPGSTPPVSRRRALTRDLNAVKPAVSACMDRHGGNLLAELPVRMRVSADGTAEHVTLPASSSAALIACVTGAIQSRRYSPGLAPETLRHVFYPRPG